jgi:hypothetical protein
MYNITFSPIKEVKSHFFNNNLKWFLGKSYIILLCFCALNSNIGFAQNVLLEVLNPNTLVLSNSEQVKLSKIQQDNTIEANWMVNVKPIETVLNGRTLNFTFPGSNVATDFQADFPMFYPSGKYNWRGYNLDGSNFRLLKNEFGYLGNAYNAITMESYGIFSISDKKTVLVRYKKSNDIGPVKGCLTVETETEPIGAIDRTDCGTNNIRVLFVYTSLVENDVPSPIMTANATISEINSVCAASGIDATQIYFELAGVKLLPNFSESNFIADDVDNLSNNTEVKALRNNVYADIVVFLAKTGHSDGLGKTKTICASNKNAYVGVEMAMATMLFSATHEIGHLIGARHNRKTICASTGADNCTNNHGFLVGTTMKTLMTEREGVCTGMMIGRFSNPSSSMMGLITGNAENNNSAILRDRAGTVACFRPDPPLLIGPTPFLTSITGSSQVCNAQGYYPFQAVISSVNSITYPLSYVWETSPIGAGSWTQVSTNNNYLLTNPANLPNYLMTIRLTVTDAAGVTSVCFFEFKRVNCAGNGGGDRELIEDSNINRNADNFISVYPNPVSENLVVKGLKKEDQLSILNINGLQIKQIVNIKNSEGELTLNLSDFPSGIYILSVRDAITFNSNKIRFIKI